MLWKDYVAGGVMAIALLFGVLALTTSWGATGDPDFFEVHYGPFAAKDVAGGDVLDVEPYTLPDHDGGEGIGLARTGGAFLVIGVAVLGLAFVATEHGWVMARPVLGTIGLAVAGLAWVLWVLGVALLAPGLSAWAEANDGESLRFGAGFIWAVVAAVLQLGALVAGGLQIALAKGFKLELAETGPANFD